MNERLAIVVFLVDGQRFALPLSSVERAVRAVEVTPLPEVPPKVQGAINVQGRVLPVISVRRWLARPDRELDPEDHLLVVHARTGRLVLLVDEVRGVAECEPRPAAAAGEVPVGPGAVCQVFKLGEDLVLVPDLEEVLTAAEALALDAVLPPGEPNR